MAEINETTRRLVEDNGEYSEQMKLAYRDELFMIHWRGMDYRLRRTFKDFAKYPTQTNESFVVGYLGALADHKLITQERYTYLLALAGQMRTAAWVAHAVRHAEL